ncbi:MAG: ATP-binding protein [Fidelibacterota bacterium]
MAGEVAKGNYKARVKIQAFDEVGKLGMVFQLMLNKVRNAMEKITLHSSDLEEKNQELVAFTRGASHDLQEPLRKIIFFADRLKNSLGKEADEKNRDYLRKIENSTERMQGLIDSLIRYSQIDFEIEKFDYIDLEEIVSEVVSDLEVQIEEAGANVEINSLPRIHGNKIGMKQLFQNLLSNSMKYSRKDVSPKISISSVFLQDNFLEIRVEDNGIGFDSKYLGKIFQPFQRLHSTQDYSGNGIGLAICQKVVRQHNGAITAEGVPDQGAVFIITFPNIDLPK